MIRILTLRKLTINYNYTPTLAASPNVCSPYICMRVLRNNTAAACHLAEFVDDLMDAIMKSQERELRLHQVMSPNPDNYSKS